jgi:hypothetical protein
MFKPTLAALIAVIFAVPLFCSACNPAGKLDDRAEGQPEASLTELLPAEAALAAPSDCAKAKLVLSQVWITVGDDYSAGTQTYHFTYTDVGGGNGSADKTMPPRQGVFAETLGIIGYPHNIQVTNLGEEEICISEKPSGNDPGNDVCVVWVTFRPLGASC